MTTPRVLTCVSFVAALSISFTLGGCASARSRYSPDVPVASDGVPTTIRFDNEAHDYVQVYLVAVQREWRLGRVAPGATAMLRIPEAALDGNPFSMRLSVLVGEQPSLRVAGDPRAETTIAQPLAAILSERWRFSTALAKGQITGLPLGRP